MLFSVAELLLEVSSDGSLRLGSLPNIDYITE